MPDPVQQYLLASGRTSFGGMRFGELRRLALDIEVVTGDGHEFPSAARAADRIVAVALADSTGFRHVVRGDRLDEARAARRDQPHHRRARSRRDRGPQHLPLRPRVHRGARAASRACACRGDATAASCAAGRPGSTSPSAPSATGATRSRAATSSTPGCWPSCTTWAPATCPRSASRTSRATWAWPPPTAPTWIPRRSRSSSRSRPTGSWPTRPTTRWRRSAWAPSWRRPTSSRPSSLPFDYQSATLRGAAAKIDSLLVREYLRRGHAVPAPGAAQSVGGGSPPSGNRASAAPVLHVDVTSLYPSLMLARGIAPASRRAGRVPRAARSPARRPRARQAPGPQCRGSRGARAPARAAADVQDPHQRVLRLPGVLERPLQRLRRRRSRDRRRPRRW